MIHNKTTIALLLALAIGVPSHAALVTQTVTCQHPNLDTVLRDVTGDYEWSLDLSNWNPDDATVNGTTVDISASPNDPVANTTTVSCTVTGNVPDQIFVRIGATQTP